MSNHRKITWRDRNSRRIALVITLLVAAGALVGSGMTFGSAHDPAGTTNDPKLVKFTSDPVDGNPTALISYKSVAGGDAPGSPQTRALRIETGPNPDTDGSFSYAGAEVVNVGLLGDALGDAGRIAFKTKGELGAGAPRVSVILSNGTVVYLSAFYCNADLNPTAWKRTMFHSRTAPCQIYTSAGGPYVSDGVNSAWTNMVAATGAGLTIDEIDLVEDENHGTVYVDDLRVGSVLFAGPNVSTHNH